MKSNYVNKLPLKEIAIKENSDYLVRVELNTLNRQISLKWVKKQP